MLVFGPGATVLAASEIDVPPWGEVPPSWPDTPSHGVAVVMWPVPAVVGISGSDGLPSRHGLGWLVGLLPGRTADDPRGTLAEYFTQLKGVAGDGWQWVLLENCSFAGVTEWIAGKGQPAQGG